MFDTVDPKQSLPDLERGILQYWKEEDIFKRSMQRRRAGEAYSFYDGPPFATGLPHYGHLLAGTIKDVIPRYQTMRGKFVQRRFGWDCHGLPIENLIEKEEKLQSKKDIEALGVDRFNGLCRSAVQRYTNEWRQSVTRMGRFVDMDWDYRTMDPEYMESIWWVFKKLHEQGLIYEGHKPMHICPRCQTPLSNFEVTQGYKDIQDYSVTAMFEFETNKSYFLAWTTTPWTLPGNLFLAVHPEVEYSTIEYENKRYIVAKDMVENVFKGKEYANLGEVKGSKYIGKIYKPLFPHFAERYAEKAFRVVAGDFVTTTDGTGIVHIAPGYGSDDFEIGQKEKVEMLQHVGMDGIFTKEVLDFAGKHAKPKDDHQSGDKLIADWLKKNKKLFKAESYSHSYPHCWRCDSPLLNYATSSWFVAVEKIKERMLSANAKTAWVPGHIRDGRFGKWLEGARDWAISRNRYWGTPLPIWKHAITGEVQVIGSRDELMAKAPERFTKIVVLRHSESEGNVQQIYQGKEPGTSLTERGVNLANETAKLIKEKSKVHPLKIIYCSPLDRTRQTAEALSQATGATIVIDDRLREVDFGEYEGKHIDFSDLAFIRERRAHKLGQQQIESVYHFPGMETWASCERRISDFLDETLPKHKGDAIAIVTHADLVMNLKHFFTGEDPHKIVHQPYPELASHRTFFWDHEKKRQMDLHKETVDDLQWKSAKVDRGTSVELTLVRHGETDLNKQKIVQGSEIDAPLNKVGKEQAKKAGELLKGRRFDVVISSNLKRAKETAMIIAKELGLEYGGGFEIFRERDLGEWTGREIQEILTEHNAPATQKGAVMLRETPKNGESFEQFISRTKKGRDWLLKEYPGKSVLLVAHGGCLRAMQYIMGASYEEVTRHETKNAHAEEFVLTPQYQRIGDVLDCWFESGSMPYAQEHFPFETRSDVPPGFPADFIAEGLDQTRGWFYTLMVLGTALFDCPPFRHCIVNGIILAEDGKKMSKRLKNYPEPMELVEKYGADAVRFALMNSPAVRGEDLRFSEKLVAETVRNVLLPLWNAYRLFVTYANAAEIRPSMDYSLKNSISRHPLDRWIIGKTQELVNRMTHELEQYDLSATCAELSASIDDLTNWYVRLSRRRFAGKGEGQSDACDTLYRVLLNIAHVLAPFCPFMTEAIYQNLVDEDHGSIHCSDWPTAQDIDANDQKILERMDATRTAVTLGLKLRADSKIKVRTPIASVTVALPPGTDAELFSALIQEELNAKRVNIVRECGDLATTVAMVDARAVGPRLGAKVQELIRAGKAGDFQLQPDGTVVILGETLQPDEVRIVYHGKEGQPVAADHGIVVAIDAVVTPSLAVEGQARELIHAIQTLRKEAGLSFTDTITLALAGADDLLRAHEALILEETRAVLGPVEGAAHTLVLDGTSIDVRFAIRN